MSTQSKRNRRRMQQSGLGGGLHIVRVVPRSVQRHLPDAPTLSDEATFRLLGVAHARRPTIAAASVAFGVPRSTLYRWRKRYDPADLTKLEPRSRRPTRTRRHQWTATQETAVLALRQRYPRYGKCKLQHLLAAQGIDLSASMIGRMLTSLRRRTLLREPHGVRVRRAQTARPSATRVPQDQRHPTEPGQLIQLDTMQRRQFTAIDVVSRCAVLSTRSRATSGTAAAFLDDLVARMPCPVQAIQVDGGSEFMAELEAACQRRGIARSVLPPHSPKLNGRVERLNGTARREFWECYDGELDLPTLQQALGAWEAEYNTCRPHQALGSATPSAYLATHDSHMF